MLPSSRMQLDLVRTMLRGCFCLCLCGSHLTRIAPLLVPRRKQGCGTSDPYAVVSKLDEDENKETAVVLGRTETIENALSPHWVKVFVLDYELGTPFKFAVSVMDEDKNGGREMGHAVFGLGEILGSRGSTKARVIKKGHGLIFATARKSTGAGTLRLKLRGEKVCGTFEGLVLCCA